MSLLFKTLKLRLFALLKIPLIHAVRPSIESVDDERSTVSIPLNHATKNHVGSMYFGALAIGADLCVGLLAMHHIEKSGEPLVLIFKDFRADYKKLVKGRALFVCEEGRKVAELASKAARSGERESEPIRGYAVVPSLNPDERVMEFTLTLSLKKKSN